LPAGGKQIILQQQFEIVPLGERPVVLPRSGLVQPPLFGVSARMVNPRHPY
jgi:hypothetical protein